MEGTAWYTLSLPVLTGVSIFCLYLYDSLLPGGKARSTDELMWIRRVDPVCGKAMSMNIATGETCEGHTMALKAEVKIAAIEV